MEVNRPRTEVITSRQRHPGLARPGKEGAENEYRRAHLPDEVERCLRIRILRDDDLNRRPAPFTGRADMLQHAPHDFDVENARNVREPVNAGGQQRRDHVLERCVLRSKNCNFTFKADTTNDPKRFDAFDHNDEVRQANPRRSEFGGTRLSTELMELGTGRHGHVACTTSVHNCEVDPP